MSAQKLVNDMEFSDLVVRWDMVHFCQPLMMIQTSNV